MKKLSLMIGIACMALAMQACGDTSLFPIDINDPGKPDNNGGNGNGNAAQLIGKMWGLESFEDVGGAVTPIPQGHTYVLSFLNENRVAGNAFCNAYDGTYTLGANGAISFAATIVTDSYCGPDSRETDYMNALKTATSYTVSTTGNGLRILYANGTKALNFQQGGGGIVNGIPVSIREVLGVTFKLMSVAMNDATGNTRTGVPVPDGQKYLLTFSSKDPGSLSGAANCNTYTAGYTLGNASVLTIEGLGATKMNCGINGSIENDFYYGLANARQYSAWQENGKSGLIVEFGTGAFMFESE